MKENCATKQRCYDDEDESEALLAAASDEFWREIDVLCDSSSCHTELEDVNPTVQTMTSCEMATSSSVTPKDRFAFPFQPYTIQVEFMQRMYDLLERGGVGIFESPTGTGKSLSIICSALTWLRQHEQKVRAHLNQVVNESGATDSSDDDWLGRGWEEKQRKLEEKFMARQQLQAVENVDKKLLKIKSRSVGEVEKCRKSMAYKRKISSSPASDLLECKEPKNDHDDIDDDDLVLDEYVSDSEDTVREEGKTNKADCGAADSPPFECTKIFYCSRTHSQLAQFVGEIRKTEFVMDVRLVTLGSRQALCVNEAVRRLQSVSLINDRCLELQKNQNKAKKGVNGKRISRANCPFYRAEAVEELSESLLVSVTDIEETVELARQQQSCPYYASRLAMPLAQLVLLPYQTLLHPQTRLASNVSLKGNVCVIDEAHNLLDTIVALHSCELSGAQLCASHRQLSQYLGRYQRRLTANNLMYCRQSLKLLANIVQKMLHGVVGDNAPSATEQTGLDEASFVLTLVDFLFQADIADINVHKLLRFLQTSQLSKKLAGFGQRFQGPIGCSQLSCKKQSSTENKSGSAVSKFVDRISATTAANKRSTAAVVCKRCPADVDNDNSRQQPLQQTSYLSPMINFENFLHCLIRNLKDGRIVITRRACLADSKIKFLLLNPSDCFQELLRECRAVILAGGTMQPVDDIATQLLAPAGIQLSAVELFSCGHVIPESNLLCLTVPCFSGSHTDDNKFEFSYARMQNPLIRSQMMQQAGLLLLQLSQTVPGGIVCFLPSYDMEDCLNQQLSASCLLKDIQKLKAVLREPRTSGEVDRVLRMFESAVRGVRNKPGVGGALLFAVVGGKLSEGINFSDELGRCVVMIGMPYANLRSVELQERMAYLNATQVHQPAAGQIYYENLCMKAVNQSIGRAIRHRDDYAAVLLCDVRYSKNVVFNKLPQWIRRATERTAAFESSLPKLQSFFDSKQPRSS